MGLVNTAFYKEINERCIAIDPSYKLDIDTRYVDDNGTCATIRHLNIRIQQILILGPSYGLHLKHSKSEITFGASRNAIEHLLCDDLKEFTSFEWGNGYCLKMPYGTKQWITDELRGKLEKLKKLIVKISTIHDPHIQYVLLKDYINASAIQHWARSIPPSILLPVALQYDEILRTEVNILFGFILNDTQWTQCGLSTNHAGLGMRKLSDKLSALFIPAMADVESNIKHIVDQNIWERTNEHVFYRFIDVAVSDYNTRVRSRDRISWDMIAEMGDVRARTSKLTRKMQTKTLNDMLHAVSIRHRAVLVSQMNKNANSWLHSSLKRGYGDHFDAAEFRILIKRKLNQPLIILEDDCMACHGGLDEYGDHGTVCPYGTGLIYRHDIVVGAYSKLLTEGKIEHTVEQRHLIEGSGMKPADIMAKLGSNGEYLCLDVGVTSTTRDTVIDKTKNTRLHAARLFYQTKQRKYSKYVIDNGIDMARLIYVPLIHEEWGGIHCEAVKIIKLIGKLRASNMNIEESYSISYCFKKLSAALQKANAIALLQHYDVYNSGSYH
eukprot:314062_1